MARRTAAAAGDSAQAIEATPSAPQGSRTTGVGAAGTALSHENRDPPSPSTPTYFCPCGSGPEPCPRPDGTLLCVGPIQPDTPAFGSHPGDVELFIDRALWEAPSRPRRAR